MDRRLPLGEVTNSCAARGEETASGWAASNELQPRCPSALARTAYVVRRGATDTHNAARPTRNSPLQLRYTTLLRRAAEEEWGTGRPHAQWEHTPPTASPPASLTPQRLSYSAELALAFGGCSAPRSGGDGATSPPPRSRPRVRSLGDWLAAWASPLRCGGPPAIE